MVIVLARRQKYLNFKIQFHHDSASITTQDGDGNRRDSCGHLVLFYIGNNQVAHLSLSGNKGSYRTQHKDNQEMLFLFMTAVKEGSSASR